MVPHMVLLQDVVNLHTFVWGQLGALLLACFGFDLRFALVAFDLMSDSIWCEGVGVGVGAKGGSTWAGGDTLRGALGWERRANLRTTKKARSHTHTQAEATQPLHRGPPTPIPTAFQHVDHSSPATAAGYTGVAQLAVGIAAPNGKGDRDCQVVMAAGPAADLTSSCQVGCCCEYGAVVDVNWWQKRAVELVDSGDVVDDVNVVSSTTAGSIHGVAGCASSYCCLSASACRSSVANPLKGRIFRHCGRFFPRTAACSAARHPYQLLDCRLSCHWQSSHGFTAFRRCAAPRAAARRAAALRTTAR